MISQQDKDFGGLQEKYRKINLVNDQVSGWSKRVCQKFAMMLGEQGLSQTDDLIRTFEMMEKITTTEPQAVQDRPEENTVEPDDAFIDFATEDFINKNIRVRPISGATNQGGADNRDRQSQASRATANQETEEAMESYQRLAEFEIEN